MRAWLRALLFSALGAALVLWPVITSPGNTIVCGWVHPDCLGNHWLLVWVAEQVAHGRSLLHNDRYYWPVGDAPWLAGNGSDGFLYLPWHLLLGWPRAAAAHAFTILVLDGLGGYALARSIGASSAASWAAATTTATMVYSAHELGAGRFSQADFGFLAFFLASWVHFLRAPNVKRALISAALLAATSILYWYYGFFAVMAGLVLGVGFGCAQRFGPRENGAPWRSFLLPAGVFSGAFLGLVGPVLYMFFVHYGDIPGAAEDAIFPHPETDGDSCWPAIPFLVGGVRNAGRALPFTTTILAISAPFLRRDRFTISLAALVLVFMGLMAGPLWPHGPYELIYGLVGPLRRFWWPYRHVVVVNLAAIALAASATTALVERLPKRFAGWGFGALVALTIPLQLELSRAPYHALFSVAQVPTPFYARIHDLPGDVLLELPISPAIASSQAPLAYQLQHGKTLLDGHAMWVSRVRPDAWDAFVHDNSFLFALSQFEQAKLAGSFDFSAADFESLRSRGLAIITLNREYFPVKMEATVNEYERVLSTLLGEPVVSEPGAKAWSLATWTGASSVPFSAFAWPKGLVKPRDDLPLGAQRPRSLSFFMPFPTQPQTAK